MSSPMNDNLWTSIIIFIGLDGNSVIMHGLSFLAGCVKLMGKW